MAVSNRRCCQSNIGSVLMDVMVSAPPGHSGDSYEKIFNDVRPELVLDF